MIEERTIAVEGLPVRYLTAGEGSALVLLHALGESVRDWQWVLPTLARTVAAFFDALAIERAAVVGNSLGGLIGLHLALTEPTRLTTLGLVASGGLGRAISPALMLPTVRGVGELATAWGRTPLGAAQRAWGRMPLLFARLDRVPPEWVAEQYRLAQLPGFMEATMATLRAQVNLGGQREVLLDQLPRITVPTLVMWGERDRVLPKAQARRAVTRLKRGSLVLIPDCGHLPQVECPDDFVAALSRFLANTGWISSGTAEG